MKRSELRKLIREYIKKINESRESVGVRKAFDIITTLEADEMEMLFSMMAKHFLNNAGDLPNMDARSIGALLIAAKNKLARRTND